MHGLTGYEELLDPPVLRRPLPFSRAWLAAFVLAVITIGWVAALDRFDAQAVAADVDSLAAAVASLETIGADGGFQAAHELARLRALSELAATDGDPRVERAWQRVAGVSARADLVDLSDPRQIRRITTDLRAALEQLNELTGAHQNNVNSSDSISLSPS